LTVDVVATRDERNLYLHMLNTDYEQSHRISVQIEDLPLAEGQAALHRLHFLTPDEATPNGPWTRAETEVLQVTPAGFAVQLPCRSATMAVIALRQHNHKKPEGRTP
jgi:hypothetical protein